MKKTILVIGVFVSLLVVTIAYSVFAEEGPAEILGSDFTSISLELSAAPHTMFKDSNGLHTVQMEGFDLGGGIGDPQLPNQVVNLALPPGVLWESVVINVTVLDSEQVDGPFKIAPVEPPATWVDGEKIIAWGEDQYYNENGENILVYNEDSFFPESNVELITLSQMRKWQFAQLSYTPVRYNPVSGTIEVAKKIRVELFFNTGNLPGDISLSDKVMDQTASIMFENFETAQDWYLGASYQASVPTTYAIITTNAIESGSTQLANFISHKQYRGYNVLTITEDEYGGLTGDPPNGTAEKIRKWLKNNYVSENIEYVLLIGNPDPDDPSSSIDSVGDVPMKMMWPYADPSYEESPTDYFYADLTGDWDLDNDGYYGEYNDDVGTGGINFAAEVYVGRIPVYGTSYTTLDKILQKTINYENASPTSIAWRQSALLPMSYSDSTTDGARLAEYIMDNYLDSAGYDSWTMYQQGTLCSAANSSYTSDEELIGDTVVRDRWSANDYGIVNWWGHGSQTSTSYGYSECGWGNLFNNAQATALDDNHPSLVYQCSCNNGWPENSANLGYSILANGGIGTVSASRVSWYYPGEWTPSNLYADNANIGYHWHREIVLEDLSAGEALYQVKNSLGSSSSSSGALLMNLYDFNLYGDPAIKISSSSTGNNPPNTPSNPSPADGSTGISITTDLQWEGGDPDPGDTVTYDVFFEAGDSTPDQLLCDDISSTMCDPGNLSSNTHYYWYIVATDSLGESTSGPVWDFTTGIFYYSYLPLILSSQSQLVDPILNGDFETGQDGSWTEYSSHGWDLISNENLPVSPHSGSWLVWLGGGNNEVSKLSQEITIDSLNPYIHFWYWAASEDYCGYDFFKVKINSAVVDEMDLCDANDTNEWVELVLDLSAYVGSPVTLMFEVSTDSSLNSNLFLDDVSMDSSSSLTLQLPSLEGVLTNPTRLKE